MELQQPLLSRYYASISSDCLAAAFHAMYKSSSPHPWFDIDTHESIQRSNLHAEDVLCLDLLREVAPAVPSAGLIRARSPYRLRPGDGKECRPYIHYGTKAFIRHLHMASKYNIHTTRLARHASYERSWVWPIVTQAQPKGCSCSCTLPHLMSRGLGRPVKMCGPPHRHGRRISSSLGSLPCI